MSISIKQLQEAAGQITDHVDSDNIRVLINSTLYGERCVSTKDYYDTVRGIYSHSMHIPFMEPIEAIEFRARKLTVDGVKCRGWYYGDILVKVTVSG